jgi:hypothetical protein
MEYPVPAKNPTPADHVTGKPLEDDNSGEDYALLAALDGNEDEDFDIDLEDAVEKHKDGKFHHLVEEILHLLNKAKKIARKLERK